MPEHILQLLFLFLQFHSYTEAIVSNYDILTSKSLSVFLLHRLTRIISSKHKLKCTCWNLAALPVPRPKSRISLLSMKWHRKYTGRAFNVNMCGQKSFIFYVPCALYIYIVFENYVSFIRPTNTID